MRWTIYIKVQKFPCRYENWREFIINNLLYVKTSWWCSNKQPFFHSLCRSQCWIDQYFTNMISSKSSIDLQALSRILTKATALKMPWLIQLIVAKLLLLFDAFLHLFCFILIVFIDNQQILTGHETSQNWWSSWLPITL